MAKDEIKDKPKEKEVVGGLTEIKATKEIDGVERLATVNYNFGKDLNEATQLFGAQVVHSNFIAKAKITAQAAMRRMLEAGKTQADITSALATWKPGVAMERVTDPVGNILAAFPGMSEEAQKELLAKLQKAAVKK